MSRSSPGSVRRFAIAASILAATVLAPFSAHYAVRAADASTLTIGLDGGARHPRSAKSRHRH